jgi:hypothetical protein
MLSALVEALTARVVGLGRNVQLRWRQFGDGNDDGNPARPGTILAFAVGGRSTGRSRRPLSDHEVDHQFLHGLDHLTAVRRAAPRGLGCRSTQTAPLSWAAATDGAAYERRRRWALADRR